MKNLSLSSTGTVNDGADCKATPDGILSAEVLEDVATTTVGNMFDSDFEDVNGLVRMIAGDAELDGADEFVTTTVSEGLDSAFGCLQHLMMMK